MGIGILPESVILGFDRKLFNACCECWYKNVCYLWVICCVYYYGHVEIENKFVYGMTIKNVCWMRDVIIEKKICLYLLSTILETLSDNRKIIK